MHRSQQRVYSIPSSARAGLGYKVITPRWPCTLFILSQGDGSASYTEHMVAAPHFAFHGGRSAVAPVRIDLADVLAKSFECYAP
jgi:hypothetical protein